MKELNDNEIRVIGDGPSPVGGGRGRRWLVVAAFVAAAVIAAVAWRSCRGHGDGGDVPGYFDSTTLTEPTAPPVAVNAHLDTLTGITRRDTVVNDIALAIYTPHNLRAALHVGELRHTAGDSIALALLAADLRADNMQIVSAFVLHGEPLSRGIAKQGFCAIIDGRVTLGVDEATPLYEQAVEQRGDFFRQFPLVHHHAIVENRVKNKALRRALAIVDGRVTVVVTGTRESLHDFSQALVDIGAETAINLVGGEPLTGWIQLPDTLIEATPSPVPLPENVNYLVFSGGV